MATAFASPPFYLSGATGFYRDGEFVATGSQMGRANQIPQDKETVVKMRLIRVLPCDGGDYDAGGAYWGNLGGNPLYCAFGESATEQAVYYFRAANREQAKIEVRSRFKNAKFYN